MQRNSGLGTGKVAALVGAIGFVALLTVDALVRDEPTPRGDDLITERMADDPLGTHTFPFAYRIAVPWLVHVVPFDHTLSFSLLAWLFSAGAGAALFVLLERFGFSRRLSIPLAVILVLSPPLLVASLRQGRSPDPLTVLVMTTGAVFIKDRRPVPLAITMAIGALNRESALFLAPWAYAVWAKHPLDRSSLLTVLRCSVPAVAIFLGLRLAIPTVGSDSVPGYSSLLGGRWEVIELAGNDLPTLARRLVTAYGPLWLLAPLAIRDFEFARRSLVLVPLCLIAFTFALDWNRVAIVAAPAVYASAAWTVRRSRSLQLATFAAWAALIAAYAAYMHFHGVQSGIIDNPLPSYPVR